MVDQAGTAEDNISAQASARGNGVSARLHDWPLRPWFLAALLGVAGFLLHIVTEGQAEAPWRMALAVFCLFAPLTLAFTVEADRWKGPAIFAAVCGAILAGIAWRTASVSDYYSDTSFWFAAGILAMGIALPLFQAGFHHTRFATPYQDTHFFVWTDAISAAGALAFTGLSWLVLMLLAQLFNLLGITLLVDLMKQNWFGWVFSGAMFGAGLGTLRNQLRVLGTLQTVVMAVFSLLAVPLAGALVLFLLAMLVTGPDALWSATKNATPILMGCVVGAFVLANAVLRDEDTEMAGSRLLRWAALVLALMILPLSVLAAISMGARVGQYGLSPERIWALIVVVVAAAYGLGYAVSIVALRIKGWAGGSWPAGLRKVNLNLAVGTGVLALLLALPIFDFGGISARNQIARLTSGAVSAEDFDYDALKWKFGDAGRAALAQLVKSDNKTIAAPAITANKRTTRPWRTYKPDAKQVDQALANLRSDITDKDRLAIVQDAVRNSPHRCRDNLCYGMDLGTTKDGKPHLALISGYNVRHITRDDQGNTIDFYPGANDILPSSDGNDGNKKNADPKIEISTVSMRQIYLDGQPVGVPFE